MAVPKPAPGTGKWWALGIALTLVFVAWLAYREAAVVSQRVIAQTLGFRIVDGRTAEIEFEVSKPPETTVVCTVQAQDVLHAVVGSATVDIPPSSERTTRHETTIRTTTPAVAALVHTCVRT
jgi:hypothetical protein